MTIQEKISNLLYENKRLSEENKTLKINDLEKTKENDELCKKLENSQQENQNLQGENAILRKNYQNLKTAKIIEQSVEDKKNIYRQFSNMITEIDKCLNLLSE
ncbi:MAG: hypothetical protein LBB53_03500 [Prevotellaceae bacterium]|jgi:hypothetical protein|nr:hypothetical protein [Prevotellaceae bacterium]